MTICGLELGLKWWRYLENRVKHVSSFPVAIAFDPTVGFSSSLVFQKLQSHQDQPKSMPGKAFIKPFQVGGFKVTARAWLEVIK